MDQTGVKNQGNTILALLIYLFDVPCHWEIRWSTLDLSNGFWRMIVQARHEHQFGYKMPAQPLLSAHDFTA
jgi:hypothetical protein